MTKEDYMRRALELAQSASENDEVPIGAVIVNPQTGEIIAEAANQGAHGGDVTSHAEILAIRNACAELATPRLWEMEMYVTLEPCTMCAAAISFARIRKLYFGAADEKGGAVINGIKFYDSPTCHHRPQYEGGILADDCASLLRQFFQKKRNKKTNSR